MSIANATLTDSSASILTCSNANGTAITAMVFTNTDSVARTITVHVCPSGEGEVIENMIVKTLSLDPAESIDIAMQVGKILLGNTDVIEAYASAGSVVTVTISYINL